MSEDTKDTPKPARKPLGLKRSVEPGEVKQTFSHGRTNKVVVEVKRKKLVGKPGAPEVVKEVVAEAPAPAPVPKAAPKKQPAAAKVDDGLTRQERQAKLLREAEEARLDAMQEARKRDAREKKEQTAEEKKRAEENRKAEAELARKAQEEIAAAEKAAAEAPAEQEAADAPEAAPTTAATAARPPARKFTPVETPKRAKPEKEKQKVGRDDRNDRRQSGKLTVNRALRGEDGAARARSLAALKRAREKESVRNGQVDHQSHAKSRFVRSSCRKPLPSRNWQSAWVKKVRI